MNWPTRVRPYVAVGAYRSRFVQPIALTPSQGKILWPPAAHDPSLTASGPPAFPHCRPGCIAEPSPRCAAHPSAHAALGRVRNVRARFRVPPSHMTPLVRWRTRPFLFENALTSVRERAAWLPRSRRRKARPGRVAGRAFAGVLSTTSRWPRRRAGGARERRAGGGGRGGGGGPGGHRGLGGRGGAGAGWSQQLLARGTHPELPPEPLDLRHVRSLGEPPGAEGRGRAGHRTQVGHLRVVELKAPAADGAHQIVVRAVGHHRHEVEADLLLRPHVVEEHLVVTVRADGRRDLAQVLRSARSEAENHHAAIEAWVSRPTAVVHRRRDLQLPGNAVNRQRPLAERKKSTN